MASLSLSVLSTTRMMNCRVGGKNHTEWPLFKRHLQLWNAKQRVGISGPRASQWALVTAMLITLCEREGERPCMTKDQRHVNVCEMWETPFKPNDSGKSCVLTTRVIQHDCDPNRSQGSTWVCLTLEWKGEVAIVTVGLLQYMVPIVTTGLPVTLL